MGEWFEYAPEDWEPSNGEVTLNPSDPTQFETAEEMYIEVGFSGETFSSSSGSGDYTGTAEGGASVVVDATQTPGDYGPETLDVEGEITADLSVTEGIVYAQTDLPDVPGGAIHAAFNLDGTGDPTYYSSGGLKSLLLDYATSARLSAAVSVVDAPVGGSTESGHFLISFSYDDTVELDITETLLGDESALADYLESKISTDFTLTIDVYDNAGDNLADSYTYTADELEAIFQ